ncbi:hypothetical protein B1C78_01475 [Thioalkalivibrio denitrificans]|uniref:Uncharacterized protein n=1 Tax=Thioalkalivibrio denitrificans TaxID=108003 RepID=A0A1V3NUR8_9GAMM|nr:hypothetical protein B1C78_01475 [Thioalkalivibrio denitrificans]
MRARTRPSALSDGPCPGKVQWVGQWSVVSGQRSAVSGQRSAVSGQRSAVSGQGPQTTDN